MSLQSQDWRTVAWGFGLLALSSVLGLISAIATRITTAGAYPLFVILFSAGLVQLLSRRWRHRELRPSPWAVFLSVFGPIVLFLLFSAYGLLAGA